MLNKRNPNTDILPELEDLSVENANIKWLNLGANATTYKKEGEERSFTLIIEDEDLANKLSSDGWNIQVKPGRTEEDPPERRLKVVADYRFPRFAPDIWMVCGNRKTLMTAETVGTLDRARIKNIDVTVHAKPWYQPDGRSGYKAVVKEMWVTIEESAFSKKYSGYSQSDADEEPWG